MLLALHCILLEKHCRHKQWNCWQKNEDLQTTNACIGRIRSGSRTGCGRQILVNSKWCFACQLIASTTRQNGFPACRQSPYLHKPAIAIVTSFSLWRLAVPVFIMTSCSLWRYSRPGRHAAGTGGLYRLLVMTSLSLWRHWRHANRYGRTYLRTKERTYGHLTAFDI